MCFFFLPVNTWLVTPSSDFYFFFLITFHHVPFCGLKTMYTQSSHYGKAKKSGESLLEEEARFWKHEVVDQRIGWRSDKPYKFVPSITVVDAWHGCTCIEALGCICTYLWCVCVCGVCVSLVWVSSPSSTGVSESCNSTCWGSDYLSLPGRSGYGWHHSVQPPIWVFTSADFSFLVSNLAMIINVLLTPKVQN